MKNPRMEERKLRSFLGVSMEREKGVKREKYSSKKGALLLDKGGRERNSQSGEYARKERGRQKFRFSIAPPKRQTE